MQEYPIHQLIDQYLLGTISAQHMKTLQDKIDQDPEVAKMVRESKLAHNAIEAHRRQQLKAELQTLDSHSNADRKRFPRWLWMVIGLLGLGALYLYLSSCYFNPEAVARNHYVSVEELSGNIQRSSSDLNHWEKADQSFNDGDYRTAIQYFAILAEESDAALAEAARWNILVAQLALEGTTPHWLLALEKFENSKQDIIAEKARGLKQSLESAAYKFFFLRLQDSVTTIKPRLI